MAARCPRGTATAAPWFRYAAEHGDAAAQFQLAAMYCTGTGQYGGSRHMAPALGRVGRPLRTVQSRRHAAEGRRHAARCRRGIPIAQRGDQTRIGGGATSADGLYHTVRGVPQYLALAHTWYEKAAAQGMPIQRENWRGCVKYDAFQAHKHDRGSPRTAEEQYITSGCNCLFHSYLRNCASSSQL
jgi:hypothetical protein